MGTRSEGRGSTSTLESSVSGPRREAFPQDLFAAAAAARRLDHEHVVGSDDNAADVAELVEATIGPLDVIASRCTGFTAFDAERLSTAAVGEDRGRHRLEKADATGAAVAAVPATRATRARADRVGIEPHGEARLEHFGVGKARVCHVRLYDARAV